MAFGVLSLSLAETRAATLLTYDFDNSAPVPAAPTSSDPGVTGSNASWTGFAGGTGFGGTFSSASVRTDFVSSSLNLGTYLTFTLTAAPGTELDLTSFSFDLGGSRNTGSTAYTVRAVLRTDAEAVPFSTDVPLLPGPVTTASATFNSSTPAYTTFTADLSGAAYQGLESLTFHLYVYRVSGPSSEIFLRLDSLDVQGTVVPEPNTAALLAVGLVLASGFRRRGFRSGVR